MSSTSMTSANALAVELWETKTFAQAMRSVCFGRMVNRGTVLFPEKFKAATESNKGDKLTFAYRGKLTQAPIGEGEVAYGNEEALELQSQEMVMNISRIPVLNPNTGTIEQQRTYVDFEEETNMALSDRVAELLDASAFNQLAGVSQTTMSIDGTTYATAAKKLHVTGHNAVIAPTSGRIIRAGSAASDEALTSADTFTLPLLDYVIERASESTQPIAKLKGNTLDAYLHPRQVTDLRHDDSSAVQWLPIQIAKIQAGAGNQLETSFENDIEFLGMYNGCNIISGPRVPKGQNSSTGAEQGNTYRAVVVGARAIAMASPGNSGKPDSKGRPPLRYTDELIDYGDKKGRCAKLLYGLEKLSPSNKEDMGVFVIATYAAQHG